MKLQSINIRISNLIWFIAGTLVTLGALGPNLLLSLFSVIVLVSGIYLLWRPGESPILFLIFGYQWLQASIKIFWASIAGGDLSTFSNYGGDIETATYLSLLALLILAVGMHLGVGRQLAATSAAANELALRYGIIKWFRLYLLAFGFAALAMIAARVVPALTQPLLAVAGFKWAFFFMLTYATFLRPFGQRRLWLLAFALEFMSGFGGYFSDFSKVLFFSFMGVLAAGIRFTPRKVLLLSVLGTLSVLLAILWTAVKDEYRAFVSGGQSAQVVTVDYAAGLAKLGSLVMDLDRSKLENASENFVSRISYVDFFGATLQHVPHIESHTHGALWLDAIIRPFLPRVIFSSKSTIDDSERTGKYSGVQVAGAGQGTSISIGYIGESYIDFGLGLMMLPIFAFGWFLGRSYRWLAMNAPTRGLVGMGLASAALFSALSLESSITKVFGALIAALLVAWLLNRFVFPRYLRWLLTRQSNRF